MASKIPGTGETRLRGRPKAFDRKVAVLAAMRLFWECGYEGASFDDLAAAMGINPSSFRNTFKTKEALYREATGVYAAQTSAWFSGVLSEEQDVRKAFARLFFEAAVRYTSVDLPRGCMISLAGTHLPPRLAGLSEMLTTYRLSAENVMLERLKQAQDDGQLAPDVDISALAGFFTTLFRGLAVQARDGATRGHLAAMAEIAMQVFPPYRS